MALPKIILLFSGKRKSGKDYICAKLTSSLGEGNCTIVRISGPLKSLYAQNHNLDLEELLSDSPYKETYREAMINWSDEIRAKDPGYFCKAATLLAKPRNVWIVSDIRRKTDVEWFQNKYHDSIKTIRVDADPQIRKLRGWVFTPGVDDVDSECNLDDYENWALKISNNNDQELEKGLQEIVDLIALALH